MIIGITLKLSKGVSPFINGLGQNAIFLYDVMSNIDIVDEVILINFNTELTDEDLAAFTYMKGYKLMNWKDCISKIQVLITLGTMPHEKDIEYFKSKPQNRIVGYKGGNNMILSTEDMLFEKKWGQKGKEVTKGIAYPGNRTSYDEIWMVPQQEYHNKDFFEISYGCRAIPVPFIWSPKFLEWQIGLELDKDKDFKCLFNEREIDQWRVASIEPNTSILKNLMPIIHSMEWGYIQNKELYKGFNITNAIEFLDNPITIAVASELDIQVDKKLVFDKRWNIVVLLSKFADMIISHQWGNPLNYAYLDIAYLGYPIIHNAHLCQDVGYYYQDYELKKAGELMNEAALSHAKDDTYMSRNRQILQRYYPDNSTLVNQYKGLLMGLYKESRKFIGIYDWKTNTIS